MGLADKINMNHIFGIGVAAATIVLATQLGGRGEIAFEPVVPSSAPAKPAGQNSGGVQEQMGTAPQGKSGNEVMNSNPGSNLGEVITRGGKDYLKCNKLGAYGSPEERLVCNSWCTNNFLPRGNDGWKGGVVVRLNKDGTTTKCEPGGINKGGYDNDQYNPSIDNPKFSRGDLRRQFGL